MKLNTKQGRDIMKQVTIETFKFNELSDEAKQIDIDQYREFDHLNYE